MSEWTNVVFDVVKQSDKMHCDSMLKVFESGPYGCVRIGLRPVFANNDTSFSSFADLYKDEMLAGLFEHGSQLLSTLSFDADCGLSVIIIRNRNSPAVDALTIRLEGVKMPMASESSNVARFVGNLRRHLHPIDAVGNLHAVLGEEVANNYHRREAELVRLEQLSTSVTEEVTQYRRKLEDEYSNKTRQLEEEARSKAAAIDEAAAKRENELDEREKRLEAKLAEVDQRESRFARRALREDLKKKLAERSEIFELTKGTRRLRWPIMVFSALLLLVFAVGAGYSMYVSVTASMSTGSSAREIVLWLRQAAFAVGFVGMAVFVLRWNNRWFEQHAQEEFRQKRFELDLDRASWLVEMAMEWQNEKGSDIPDEIVRTLSAGLFESAKTTDPLLHPADQLASALLGAAASATVKVPGGEICLDRKGVKALAGSTPRMAND